MIRYYALSLILASSMLTSTGFAKKKSKPEQTNVQLPVPAYNYQKVKKLLYTKKYAVPKRVAEHALTILRCSKKLSLGHRPILTIIDYTQPTRNKRLWVFDLQKYKLLHHARVTHGIRSGEARTTHFSNKHNSKASSMGLYLTGKDYKGRYGHSLKLHGQEQEFNANAYNRFLVIHPAWYASNDFVKRYGRAGRSWGCPSLPPKLTTPIINSIKDRTLLIAYHDNTDWQYGSSFLNCRHPKLKQGIMLSTKQLPTPTFDREKVLISDRNENGKRERNDPILTISAIDYKALMQQKCPLKRMLRRQIDKQEYIALSPQELNLILDKHPEAVNKLRLYMPNVKKVRGYWATEFINQTPSGEIKITKLDDNRFKFHAGEKDFILSSYSHDIRWLGL